MKKLLYFLTILGASDMLAMDLRTARPKRMVIEQSSKAIPTPGLTPWKNKRPDSSASGQARRARLYSGTIKAKNFLIDFFKNPKNRTEIPNEPVIENSPELQQFIDDLVVEDIWQPMSVQEIGRIFYKLYSQWPANLEDRFARHILTEEFQTIFRDIRNNLAEQEVDDHLFDLNILAAEQDFRAFLKVFMQTYYPDQPIRQWHVNLANNLFAILNAENRAAVFNNFVHAEQTKKINKAFQILGLAPTATPAEIKARYRQLALVHHPDRPGGNAERFRSIQMAYELLAQ
ncbi:hypothetical protein A3J41_01275 [candidate division TM6 bacterium RIFCSPHIGHO2_12_FULL_38_8]|nr:MAG: hypothetical protein A3J41_01275 [candidate division TM6 bacterium RIFCSPHIGHO2_12_FULL_38_8]